MRQDRIVLGLGNKKNYMNKTDAEWVYLSKEEQRNPFFGEVQHRVDENDSAHVKVIIKPAPSLGFELACAAHATDVSKSMMPE